MFEILKKLWAANRINENMLDNAILKGWINEEQKSEIMTN